MVLGDNDFPCYHDLDCLCDSCQFAERDLSEEECEVYENGERQDNREELE